MHGRRPRFLALLVAVWIGSNLAASAADFVRGEANGDGTINIADPVLILNYLFNGTTDPIALCRDVADSNDDGVVNIADPVALLGYLFEGLGRPPDPFPSCGRDPTIDRLTCTFAASCSSAAIAFGPQLALASTTSMTVAWRSPRHTVGAVEVEPADGGEPARSFVDASARSEHVIELTGLEPDTKYLYRILHDDVSVSEGHHLVTASADPAAPIRFGIFGDSGVGSTAQYMVAERVLNADCDLVLMTGDILYTDALRGYFEPYRRLIDHIPFYPALGNHDVGGTFLDLVHLPVNDVDGTENFFSFDRGDVHIVAIHSSLDTSPGSDQHTWLAGDLAANTSRWIFATFHFPFYSTLSRDIDSFRENVRPLFDQHNVDIAFAGHDHNYQRTFPMREDLVVDAESEPDYVDPGGTIYVVTGGGGAILYGEGGDFEFTATKVNVHHFTQVDVSGSRVTVSSVAVDGTVVDTMMIMKTAQ